MDDQNCGVCGNQGHGLHFGIVACRACSSFFRRTIAERKTYNCRTKNQCSIKKGLRNTCRACRFQKCILAGMKIDLKQTTPVEHEAPSSNSTEPSASTTPSVTQTVTQFWTNRDCRTLNKLVEGIYNYKTSEKSLFIVNHPSHIFSTIKEFKMIDEVEYPETLRGSISLVYSMLNEYFPVFNQLIPTNKILVIKTIYYEMQLMYQGVQSINYFAEDDERIYMSYGYYVCRNMDDFFKDHQKRISAKDLCTPTMEMMLQIVKKMRALKVTEIDVAVLGGIIFCQAMINLNLATEALHKFRHDLITDYHHYLLNTYGLEESGVRGADIFCLLLDAKNLNFKIQEFRVMAKIFIPDFIDHWGSAVGET